MRRGRKGRLNKLIDECFHPFFPKNKAYIILDGIAHFLVEGDPASSIAKFAKYSLPKLLEGKNRAKKL